MVIESIPKIVGMVYAIVAIILLIVLLRQRKLNKKIGYIFLAVSSLLGFLIFAPMIPYQFQAVILGNVNQLGSPIALAIIALVVFVVLTFVAGRVFCGYVCPIGTVQELLYNIPTKKIRIHNKSLSAVFRYTFLVVFIVMAVTLSIGLLKYLGVRDFFYLNTSSAFFYVFVGLLTVSVFFYRPFCRFTCPYGALLSLVTLKSRFRLRRNENCTDCGECEEECPTSEAGRTDLKQECYLCQRCLHICLHSAIDYTKNK